VVNGLNLSVYLQLTGWKKRRGRRASWAVCALVLLLIFVHAAVSAAFSTEVFIWETFELGTIDPTVWTFTRHQNTGSMLIVPEGEPYGLVLHIASPSNGLHMLGSLFVLPPFDDDDVLMLQMDVRRNSAAPYFSVAPAKWPEIRASHGEAGIPTTITSTAWAFPGLGYRVGLYGDHVYPGEGFTEGWYAGVVTTPTYQFPPFWHRSGTVAVPGSWYTIRYENTRSSYTAFVDGAPILVLDDTEIFYRFHQIDDWILMLGDGGTNTHEICDVSIDNIVLVHTKDIILDLFDTFGKAFAELDDLFNQFGSEVLRECLECCSISWDAYLTCLQATLRGDLNGDGRVDLLDVRICHQIARGIIAPTAYQLIQGDVDDDGDVDMDDARILAEYVIGIRTTLP
jgi:dockerin type I repeat protein